VGTTIVPAMLIFGGIGVTGFALYVVALCVIPLAVVWRPILALYLLVPLLPLQTLRYQLQVLPFGDKFVDLLLVAAIVGYLMNRSDDAPAVDQRLKKYALFYCGFLFVMLWYGSFVLHLPWPLSPSNDRLADWKNMVEMPILFILVTNLVRTRRQMVTLLALMMLTVLRANIGFFHTVSGRDFTHFSNNLRYAGVLGYAGQNGLAAFMAEFTVILLAIAPAAKQWWFRALIYASVVMSAYCVVFSFSRGGYVGVLVGLAVLGLLRDRHYLIVLVILLATWQTLLPNAVRERITMTYDGEQVESSANERLELWQDAFTIIPEHPVLGTGFVTYRYLGRSADYLDTHNFYVKVIVETGFVGLVLFLVLLWVFVREGWALFLNSEDPLFQRLGLGVCAMIACVAAVNLFGDRWMYQQITGYMWTFLGLAARARAMQAEPDPSEEVLSGPHAASLQEQAV